MFRGNGKDSKPHDLVLRERGSRCLQVSGLWLHRFSCRQAEGKQIQPTKRDHYIISPLTVLYIFSNSCQFSIIPAN
ncbi:hypothetical protein Q8A67_012315 [Cirrhinus molitorella]|uniref:Uncharacterized protein n=1 Tax=Cirrhinus molitorella TaxID=172907 RepID=A0AA88TQJ4_9TELE|nr:hypothetical protein Q8A67_012315 [Cirrhinus molitorella]